MRGFSCRFCSRFFPAFFPAFFPYVYAILRARLCLFCWALGIGFAPHAGAVRADDVAYGYDALGRMVSVAEGGQTAHYDYDAAGNLTAIRRPVEAAPVSSPADAGREAAAGSRSPQTGYVTSVADGAAARSPVDQSGVAGNAPRGVIDMR